MEVSQSKPVILGFGIKGLTMSARRILIVEDEKPIRDMIAFGLRRAGYEVREAED